MCRDCTGHLVLAKSELSARMRERETKNTNQIQHNQKQPDHEATWHTGVTREGPVDQERVGRVRHGAAN